MRENNQRQNPFILATALTLPIVAVLGIVSFVIAKPLEKNVSYIIGAVLVLLTFGLPTFFYFRLRGGKWISSCMAPWSLRGAVLSVSAALLMMAHSTVVRTFTLGELFAYRIYTLYGIPFFVDGDSFGSFMWAFAALAILPALLEGIFFRGILTYEYRYGGVFLSILMPSVLYALTGMSFSAFPLYFLNGIMLSVIVFLTGNVFCSVFAHMLYISFAMLGEKYLLFLAQEAETRAIMLFLLFGTWVTVAIFFFDAAEKLLRKRGENEQPKPIGLSKRNFFIVFYDIFLSPMLWADVFCFFIFAILHLFL